MKKINILLITILILFSSGCFFKNKNANNDIKVNKQFNDVNKDEIAEKVNNKIKEMTLEEKIAQMLVVYHRDPKTYDDFYKEFKDYKPGGFILFKENMGTFIETRNLIEKLNNYNDIPLIVGMDQEGGLVQRLKYLKDVKVTDIPYMYYLGQTNNEILANEVGKVIAEELRTIGVNVVFSPDVDIYSNLNNTVIGKRSFGSNYLQVSKMANALANGLENNGVIPTYKHFPGHGDTEVDSHQDLPIINKTYQQIKDLELQPFKSAIENEAKLIMVGHIAMPNITKDNKPATLSKTLITDILKNDMGYKGLVITDALNMKALTNNYTAEEIVVESINAGVDILLMPPDIENTIKYIKSNISIDRIEESVRKILTFKYKYLSNYELLGKEYLGSIEHQEIISKIPVNN